VLAQLTSGQAVVAGIVLLALSALLAQAWLLMQFLRQQGRIILRLDAIEAQMAQGPGTALPSRSLPRPLKGLPIGSAAPAFKLSGLHGETLTLASLLAAGNPVLLVFTDPDCGPCTALLPQLAQWQRGLSSSLVIALIVLELRALILRSLRQFNRLIIRALNSVPKVSRLLN